MGVEFHQGEQAGQQHAEQAADDGHIAGDQDQKGPEQRVLHADKGDHHAGADGNHQAGDGLNPQIAFDAVADVLKGLASALALGRIDEQPLGLVPHAGARGEQEAQIDHHQHSA